MTARFPTFRSSRARLGLIFLLAGAAALPMLAAAPEEAASATQRIFHWRPFLAPFHAVVLHFPIGFLTVAVLLELYRWRRPSEELRRATTMVLWLGLGTGVSSATFGVLRAETGGYDPHAVQLHRAFGLLVPILTAATLAIQGLAWRWRARWAWTYGYRLCLAGTLAVIVAAGHLGGNLTHGSRYLVENAPEFVRELIDDPPAISGGPSAALTEHQHFFVEKVQPILSAKCYSCHGSQKQKSGYRLDRPDLLLKGGESGKVAVKPGDPGASQLVRLILLPAAHDDVMPPAGKEPLTRDEIMTILTWVRDGADLPEVPAAPDSDG